MNINAQIVEDLRNSQFIGQSDGFFRNNVEFHKINNDEYELVLLPKTHGLDYNYPADNASIGQGVLLLSAFGVLYMIRKRY